MQLPSLLAQIPVLARRLLLDTPGARATVPMLRGVWGRALHGLDQTVYDEVFGDDQIAPAGPTFRPRGGSPARADAEARPYILRPAPPDPQFAPAVDFLLIGPAMARNDLLCRAWDVASGMGLGPRRAPFFVRAVAVLDAAARPNGIFPTLAAAPATPFTLDQAALPLPAQETAPCRLSFNCPLRLRRQGRLIEAPALPDLVLAACRRVRAFLPQEARPALDQLAPELLEHANNIPATAWRGERCDLHRYSGRQHAELDLHGVTGSLDLPAGTGALAGLLAAAQWLHLGKATVMGLGQLTVHPL